MKKLIEFIKSLFIDIEEGRSKEYLKITRKIYK